MEWFRPRRLPSPRRFSWRWLSTAVLVMAVLSGCGGSTPGPAASPASHNAQSPPQLHVHANGLQLSVAEDYRVTTTPVGFRVQTVHVTRSPIEVSIQLLETRPQATGWRFRHLGSGRILWYSVTQETEGGSGGVDYTVVAFERVGNRWIQYRQVRQGERQPVFELWEIARSLHYLPSS